MASLTEKLGALAGRAFAEAGLPVELGRVTVSDRPDLAQFQCNGAMAAAKLAKKPPRAMADGIAAQLKKAPELRDVTVGGPGFINFNVTDECLAAHISAIAA